jgi:hypothetical protein
MPSKEKDAIVETQADETAACCTCGTHGRRKIIVHAVIGVVALFMLCTVFAFGAVVGKFAGNHEGGRGHMYQQYGEGRGGRMMQQGGGYGRGMMNGGHGYYYNQQGTTEDSTVPETQTTPATPATPAPATPQGGATQ